MKDPEGLTAEALAAIRPLPFGRGESRGEGSASPTTGIRNDESFEQRATSFHLSFPSELAAARQACRAVRHFLATEKLTEKEQVACELALTEACNNAVLYAEGFGQRAPLEIQALCRRTGLELQVIDHTPGFDWPAAIALPRAEAEQGRGLFIIHSLMNEVVYLRGRGENRLIMRKQLGARDSLSAPTDLHRPPKPALPPSMANNLTNELEIARRIQQSLLPKTFPPLAGLTLAGFCRSAQQVGGDFYDVLPLSETSALIVVADVMGKGVPAALFAATLRTLLRTTAEWTHRPAELLARINRLMFAELSAVDMFITVQLALVDVRRQCLVVTNAGHCPVLVASESGPVQAHAPDGVPIGILPNATFAEAIILIEKCRCALFYSDGLTEARNLQGDFFGPDRLMDWLSHAASQEKTAVQLTENFKSELHRFQSGTGLSDDQTFLLLRQETRNAIISPKQLIKALPVLAPLSSVKSPI